MRLNENQLNILFSRKKEENMNDTPMTVNE